MPKIPKMPAKKGEKSATKSVEKKESPPSSDEEQAPPTNTKVIIIKIFTRFSSAIFLDLLVIENAIYS